ncbi:hypothetical protein C8Q75DRAFT_734247 [Abortiporus biennis]|nr:hypothetical protein C8Q75DRAFT_734247 [Abortiporus biennis]
MIYTIPSELNDYIIDFLHDDPKSLSSCSTTCRAWLPASRYHLFYRIVLTSPKIIASFRELAGDAKAIGTLVRELHLSTTDSKPVEQQELSPKENAAIFNNAFSSLIALETLQLTSLIIGAALQSNLVFHFRSVTRLTLHYCHFPTFGSFVQLFRSFPNVKTLALRGVSWEDSHHLTSAPINDARTCKLESLSLGRDMDYSILSEWILAENIHAELEYFSCSPYSEEDTAMLSSLVEAFDSSLKHFEIDWYSSARLKEIILPPSFKFGEGENLQSLELKIPIFDGQRLPWVTSLLSCISASALESIVFEIRVLGNLDAIDWESIDNILANPRFRHLQNVRLNVLIWRTATIVAEDLETLFRRLLPRLDSMNILMFSGGRRT